ncbi:hypothetical protein SAMN05444148_0789 [Winogradskyella jejuensis]|uniref:Uncharacterized protein n=1 Tax=Winogradskyella jejuensis TaxID=1089305 RepID=A0A1M5M306_9FLAO|nr:hypothetical protein SAMN05444148_0789 [Winogradskyella jejuensis]
MDYLLSYISDALTVIVFILYLISYKKNSRSKRYIIFFTFLSVILIISSITSYYHSLGKNNLFISHFYFSLRFLTLSLFYMVLLFGKQKKTVSVTLKLVIPLLTIYYLGGLLGYYNIVAFHPFEVFICSFPISVFAVMYTYNAIEQKLPYMYVNIGLLIYITISTLLFILAYVLNSEESTKYIAGYLWSLNAIFWNICLLLFVVEWWKNFRVKKAV